MSKKTEKPWMRYIENVESGQVVACKTIKESVKRFRDFEKRTDIYFDEKVIIEATEFISNIKHFLGKSAGKPFILEDWQSFILADILCWKWKSTKLRVCREVYIQVARKAGKDALMAALCLYLMVAEGESAPEIVCAANSTDQARILFEYIKKFGACLDPSTKTLKPYRNMVKCLGNSGYVQVISSDASKMDGKNISCFVIDEYHESRTRAMYDVLRSSQGMRENPLGIIITTAGFNLDSPCHDMYELGIQVLAGVKTMDNFRVYIWELDEEDKVEDETNWIKCQPNLGVTVTREFMAEEYNKAVQDSTAMSGVLTKTFNKWVQSRVGWIEQPVVARQMQDLNLEDFRGRQCVIGCDLGAVSDFSAISALFPPISEGDKYYFFNWVFLPNDTLKGHPWQMLYDKFIDEGCMEITPGNVTDYDAVIGQIRFINEICPVSAIYLDKFNATQFEINLNQIGFTTVEFSQGIGHFSGPTKEMERIIREGSAVIQKSSCVLWQFGNATLKTDWNGNIKVTKEQQKAKVDSVIAMCMALGGNMHNPVSSDLEIFVI